MAKSSWVLGWGMLLGLLQVLVLLLLLEEHRRHLGLQDPDFSMLEVCAAAGAIPRVGDSGRGLMS